MNSTRNTEEILRENLRFLDGDDVAIKIGSIYIFDDMVNEKTVATSNFHRVGQCDVEIRSSEGGAIPHFHIIGTQRKFLCAVCLDTNMYFKHGEYTDELNSRARKDLDKLLRKEDDGISKWKEMVIIWNNSSENVGRSVASEQPDYTTITESTHK